MHITVQFKEIELVCQTKLFGCNRPSAQVAQQVDGVIGNHQSVCEDLVQIAANQ